MRTLLAVIALMLICGLATAQEEVVVPPGVTIVISVQASGGELQYQWSMDSVPLVDAGRVSGVTSNSLRITMVRDSDSGDYGIRVFNDLGETSDSLSLRILAPPQIVVPINVEIVDPIAGVVGHNLYIALEPGGDFQQVNAAVIPPGGTVWMSLFDDRTVYWISRAVHEDGGMTPVFEGFTLTVAL